MSQNDLQTPAPLLALAEHLGVLPEYHDIWGRRHVTSEATYRAILAQLGADPDAAAHPSPVAHSSALPPVVVVASDQATRITLHLPQSSLTHPHHWRITLEHGHSFEQHFMPADLPHQASGSGSDGLAALALHLPPIHDAGYHSLALYREDMPVAGMSLIVHPHRCYQPEAAAQGRRAWGLSTQLYGLQSRRNWGVGDYADLVSVVDWAARAGAALVGVNPLHALFPHNPAHASPYSPSSRRHFNVLPIAVEALPELSECLEAQALIGSADFRQRMEELRNAPLVDYPAVARLKFQVLEILYRHFRQTHLADNSPRARAFHDFVSQGGQALSRFCLYHALQDHFYRQDTALWGWPVWPEAFRDVHSQEVAAFAQAHPDRVEWHAWLQWLADGQLADAARRSFDRHLGVGLYLDLAVGVDRGGAETWMDPHLYALDAKVGCPPDDFNPSGQDWGLPPWVPQRLTEAAYAPYIAILRENMKHAGALRIDHVMGLMRLYWVPPGLRGDQGAYVRYPVDDLLGILALESQRNQCLIIGEDLGTVPDEIRHALHELGVLSYRLFYFERDEQGGFLPPERYPEQALVSASTHDLPTLRGFWRGLDIDWRTRLDLYPSESLRQSQIREREEDRQRVMALLAGEGALPGNGDTDPNTLADLGPLQVAALHRHLARSPSRIVLAQAEDLAGALEQANLPGTVDSHPNWRRKLPLPLEEWAGHEGFDRATQAMTQERG